MSYTARQSITIAASKSKVWEALTNPDLVRKYFFGTTIVTTWKQGNPILFKGEWEGKPYEDKGTILDIETEKLIRYSYWSNWSGKPDLPEYYNTVTYQLFDRDGKTEYAVEQSGIESEEAARSSEKNWLLVMEEMKKMIEAGE